ncbi:MAG TPA: PDZ domain-containing protein [Candidatus Eisenbacteria bacterium]|nr:PDZ domain-containing protein [Candidatus Eisenbacteria bacterium]
MIVVDSHRFAANWSSEGSYQGTTPGVSKRNRKGSAFRRYGELGAGFLVGLCLITSSVSAQTAIDYIVTLTNPEKHLIEVQIALPPGSAERELQLPVWNALYQVRDFSQFINWIRAKDPSGQPLQVQEMNTSRWKLDGAANGATVEYQMYVDSFGPFGAQFNSHHAFFNLAQILMYPADSRNAPITLLFSALPSEWHVAMALPPPDFKFHAENYDRLVDSPAEIGLFRELKFDEQGAHFRVVVDADPADYDSDKLTASLHKIVASAITWMNDRPFDTYTFFYHFPRGPAGGGMEHAYSTAIDINADTIRQNLYPVNAVTAHEFFHLWNVKRIRPQTLEPIDYTKANYTRALWFSEGVTSTAENIILLRAGLMEEKQFLAELGEEITELEHRPAHLTQSAEESSLGAWLEGFNYYRRPERSISYYNKGELLGFMLDLEMRNQSHGQASLRELMQWMNDNYAKKRRYFDDSNGVREAGNVVCHCDLAPFFTKYVAGTVEIPWNNFFSYVGLLVEERKFTVPDPGFLASRNFDGPMSVVAVTSASEAERAGLRVGDALSEIQGKAAGEESQQILARLKPGDTITVKVKARRGERELTWKIGGREETSYEVRDVDQVTPEQRAHRAAWLRGEAEDSTPEKKTK